MPLQEYGHYFAELYHRESATRGAGDTTDRQKRFRREVDYMKTRWRFFIDHDPSQNPDLTLRGPWPSPASFPRASKPWMAHQLSR